MSKLSVSEKQIYLSRHPEHRGKTDSELISIMQSDKEYISIRESQQISLFGNRGLSSSLSWYGIGNTPDLSTDNSWQRDLDIKRRFSNGRFELSTIPGTSYHVTAEQKRAMGTLINEFERINGNYESYRSTEGWVSDFVNWVRETSSKDATRSNVDKLIEQNRKDIELLKTAYSESLYEIKNDELKQVSFREIFAETRGVEYNPDNIEKCQTSFKKYMELSAQMDAFKFVSKISGVQRNDWSGPRQFASDVSKTLEVLGLSEEQKKKLFEHINKTLQEEGYLKPLGSDNGLCRVYMSTEDGKPVMRAQSAISTIANQNANWEVTDVKLQRRIASIINDEMKSKYEECFGKTWSEGEKELAEAELEYKANFKAAYGGGNGAEALAERYANAQREGVGYVTAVSQVLLAAGAVFTGGATSACLGALAMLNPAHIVERATDSDGMTRDEWMDYGVEMLKSLPWMAVGFGVGKVGDATRSLVKLQGLRGLAAKSGQSLDDFVKSASVAGKLDAATTKALSQTELLSNAIGVSTEAGVDIMTTLAFRGEASTEDWVQVVVDAMLGSVANNKLSKLPTSDAKVKYLQETFKDFKLTPEEAKKILSAMDESKPVKAEFDRLHSDVSEVILTDLDGAHNIPTNPQNRVNTYKYKNNPDVPLKEYFYTLKNGQTYKFMAPENIGAKSLNYLARMDVQRRAFASNFPKFNQFSDNVQIGFTKLFMDEPSKQLQLKELLLAVRDEASLANLMKDKKLLDTRLNDIKELETIFKPKDFGYLDGLLDVKNSDPAKYKRIAESGIFDLIQDGKIDASSLYHISKNADLSPEIYKDLELIKSGKSIVPEFPNGTDLKTAFEQTSIGDAVEVGNKMYLNDGQTLIEWNMSKEKYLELFPPVQRFTTTQGAIGDCHLIQTLGLAMQNPKARVQFLQSFSMQGNDVVVTIKGLEDYHGSNTFPNGEITLASNNKHLTGCKGLQMYEQTYSKVALKENTDVYYPGIASIDDIMDRSVGGQAAQTMADVFGQGHVVDITPIGVLYPDGSIKMSSSYTILNFSRIPLKLEGETKNVNLNVQKDAATKIKLFDKFFIDYPDKTLALRELNIDTTEALLTHAAGNPDFMLSFGTLSKAGAAAESALLPEYNLISNHAYSILDYDKNTKTVKIGNPHAYSEVTEIPLEILHKYIRHLDFLKL